MEVFMIQKRFPTLIATLIIATVPVHGAQQTFMQKWIVEPSSVILKSKKTWAFAVGAALCCAVYKGYKRCVKDTTVVEQAQKLLSDEYCVIPNQIGDIKLKNERDVQAKAAKPCIIEYITNTLVPNGLIPKTDKVCTCQDTKLSVSDRLCRILTIRANLLKQLYNKLGSCNPVVRLWQQNVTGTNVDTLRTRLLAQRRRSEALVKLLQQKDVQQAINTACDYRGTTTGTKGCVSIYCLTKYKKTYSNQS
jgi:hypothetical protein